MSVRSPPLWAIQSGLRPSQPGLMPSQPGLRQSQLSLRPSQPGLRPSQPGLRPSQPGLRPSQPASQVSGFRDGWLGLRPGWMAQRGGMDGRTDELTNGRKISPFYRTLSPIGAAALPAPMKTKEKVEQGKGCADHLMPLGYLLFTLACHNFILIF